MTATVDGVLFELFLTPDGEQDPYSRYAALHEAGPLHRWSRDGCWYATSYEVCRELLIDPRVGHDAERLFRRPGMTPADVERTRQRQAEDGREPGFSMISENPPSHTRLRRLVSRAFTTPRIERLRPQVERLVDERLDAMAAGGDVDAMTTLAFPLPVTVISELVGVPEGERERFRAYSDGLAGIRPASTQAEVDEAVAAFNEMEEYCADLITQRRAAPADDLLSALIAVRDEDDGRLTDQELRDTILLLYFAGFVTTASLIGNGLLALFHHPAQRARLWADGSLAVSAVEEFLRYDGPIDALLRDLLEPVVVGGVPLDAGEHVFLLVAAANRDPAHFPDPTRLDIGRPVSQAVSFGWGIHHCLGAPLARLEAQVVFSRMRERFADIELCGPEPRRVTGIVRRPATLPVRVHPR
ncbi:MAG: cytochrome P450 [Acidimicrobiia bacterium]